jgi:hypothetical protein
LATDKKKKDEDEDDEKDFTCEVLKKIIKIYDD